MKDTIIYVGGGKGGVGKSLTALTLIQFLIDRFGKDKKIHLIETDESNPDVGRVYREKIPITTAILDENEKGWILMADLFERSSNSVFVINSAARSNMGIRKNGRNLAAVLERGRLPYNFVTLWPMNRQKDSVALLEDFLKYITFGPVYPIRNCYFGEPDDFALYAKYLAASELLRSRISITLDFPALADIIADDFYTGGKTIPEAALDLGAFAEQSFLAWRNQVYEMFEGTGEFGLEPEAEVFSDEAECDGEA
jgi:hypothetical protein